LNQFGIEVKKMLIEKGITQHSIAKKIELTDNGLSNALKRENVGLQQMQRIAEALNCDLKIELIPKREG